KCVEPCLVVRHHRGTVLRRPGEIDDTQHQCLAMHEGRGVRRDRSHGAAGQEDLPFGAVVRAGPAAKVIEYGGDGFGGERSINVARALCEYSGAPSSAKISWDSQ